MSSRYQMMSSLQLPQIQETGSREGRIAIQQEVTATRMTKAVQMMDLGRIVTVRSIKVEISNSHQSASALRLVLYVLSSSL